MFRHHREMPSIDREEREPGKETGMIESEMLGLFDQGVRQSLQDLPPEERQRPYYDACMRAIEDAEKRSLYGSVLLEPKRDRNGQIVGWNPEVFLGIRYQRDEGYRGFHRTELANEVFEKLRASHDQKLVDRVRNEIIRRAIQEAIEEESRRINYLTEYPDSPVETDHSTGHSYRKEDHESRRKVLGSLLKRYK